MDMRMTRTLIGLCLCYVIFVGPIVFVTLFPVPPIWNLVCYILYWMQVGLLLSHGSFLEVFRQKNFPAGFLMSLSNILSTDSKTVNTINIRQQSFINNWFAVTPLYIILGPLFPKISILYLWFNCCTALHNNIIKNTYLLNV